LITTSSTVDCESYEFTDLVVARGKEATHNIVKRESLWIAVNLKKKWRKIMDLLQRPMVVVRVGGRVVSSAARSFDSTADSSSAHGGADLSTYAG
jgi:hypothetical protein